MSEHRDNPGAAPVLVGGEMPYGSDVPAPLGVLVDLLLGATAAELAEICPAATVLVRRTANATPLASRGVQLAVRAGAG